MKNEEVKDSIIEVEITKLIDDVINDIKLDLINSKNDLDSYLFGLGIISQLEHILVEGDINKIITLEYTYKNGGIVKFQEILSAML